MECPSWTHMATFLSSQRYLECKRGLLFSLLSPPNATHTFTPFLGIQPFLSPPKASTKTKPLARVRKNPLLHQRSVSVSPKATNTSYAQTAKQEWGTVPPCRDLACGSHICPEYTALRRAVHIFTLDSATPTWH